MKFYGVDPVPVMNDIVKRATKMRNDEFHLGLARLFLSLRDFQ
jgi:hypothetical protein